MAVTWTDDLATGVNKIDDQHKELFSRINSLLVALYGFSRSTWILIFPRRKGL